MRRPIVHPRWCYPSECTVTAQGTGSHGSRYFYVDERITVQLVKPESIGRPTIHIAVWRDDQQPAVNVEPREVITFSVERASLLVNTVADMIERVGSDQS
ncbi:hypothetical protein ACGFH8_11905 [Micromonospora sp. NPDC049175]|uniref:hypothetical protein n=1 Tax=Micromonospora sp. NPDC049175 TaxID=3364266 RepID=UPI003717BAA5